MNGNGLRSGVHACYGFLPEGVKNPYRMQGKGLRSHLSRQTGRLRLAIFFSLFPAVFPISLFFPLANLQPIV